MKSNGTAKRQVSSWRVVVNKRMLSMFVKARKVGLSNKCQVSKNKTEIIHFRTLGRKDDGGLLTPGKLKPDMK